MAGLRGLDREVDWRQGGEVRPRAARGTSTPLPLSPRVSSYEVLH